MWISPREALERGKRGEIELIFPTRSTLSDLAAIGAGPTERNGRTVALASQVPDERPTKRRKAEPVAETATEPVRPSLAADAIRYLREGAEGPGVILPVEYCRALVARL